MTEEKEELRVPIRREVAPKEDVKLIAGFNKGLSKFRQQVKAPAKRGKVDYQTSKGRKKYDYVLLDDLIKSIDAGIKDTGISWSQEVETIKNGVRVRTLINADNGYQYVSPWLTLQSGTNPQDIGSAITYARRYSLGTTFGINSEADDDGESANESTSNASRSKPAPNRKPVKPSTSTVVKTKPALLNTINNLNTTLAKNHDIDPQKSKVALEKKMNHDFTKLNDKQAQEVIAYLTKKLNEESQVGVK